jgi:methylmalonyl-CoA mutase N-terminal domain/subunit
MSLVSRRLARNTQIVLQEESHLNRVIGPADRGSWSG